MERREFPDCRVLYLDLSSRCQNIVRETFENDLERAHAKSHSFVNDLCAWIRAIGDKPERKVLEVALLEYQYALLALAMGLYRQSFMSLRLFLELSLASVFYSAREIDLRLWFANLKDNNWQTIIDDDTGVFSTQFCNAFFPELVEEVSHYRNLAKMIYRECSEYIHGNWSTAQKLSFGLGFDKNAFEDWHRKAGTVRLIVVFALTLRYLAHLGLDRRAEVEDHILEELGYLSVVRDRFAQSHDGGV